jgi:hypothetical protein
LLHHRVVAVRDSVGVRADAVWTFEVHEQQPDAVVAGVPMEREVPDSRATAADRGFSPVSITEIPQCSGGVACC